MTNRWRDGLMVVALVCGHAAAGAEPPADADPQLLPVITLAPTPLKELRRHFGWECDSFLLDDFSRYRGEGCGRMQDDDAATELPPDAEH